MPTLKRIASSPAVIFGAAFISRLASAVYILARYSSPRLLFSSNEPSHIAAALASGMGFAAPYSNVAVAPSAQQPPLYPLLLAGIFKVFGTFTLTSAWMAVLVNVFAGAVTAVLLYRVGKIHFSETVGIWAAWLWVLPWTYQINTFSVSLTSACLAAMGLTALFLWTTKSLTTNWRWLGFGVHSGILALLQPSLFTVIVLYGGWLALRRVRRRQVWIAMAGLILVVTPWTFRNYLVFGRLIPLRDNFGLELWLGNRPGMSGTVDFKGDFPDADPTNYARLGELPFMDSKFRESKEFIQREPVSFVGRVLRRTVEFWYRPYSLPWIVVAIIGCAGAALLAVKDRHQWVWIAMSIVFPLVYYITHNFPNYRHPIEPVVILLAGYGLAALVPYGSKGISDRFGTERKKIGEPGVSSPCELEAMSIGKNQSVRNSLPAETQKPVNKAVTGESRSSVATESGIAIEGHRVEHWIEKRCTEEHWIDLADGRMRYLKAGNGPALILIHGLLGYAFSWRFTIPALARHATVYAIDNLGAGLSPARAGIDCTLRGTAKRVMEFADALGITNFDVLGTSHGGGVAIMVAAICVERKTEKEVEKNHKLLRRLILSAPINPWSQHGKRLAPFLGSKLGSILFRNTIERWRFLDPLWLSRMFGDESKIPPDSLDGYRLPIFKNNATRHGARIVKTWISDLAELEAALPTIRDYPTLLLWGTKDGAVDIGSAAPLQRNFQSARLITFEGVGHLPYEEVPEDFNRALIDFLIVRNPT